MSGWTSRLAISRSRYSPAQRGQIATSVRRNLADAHSATPAQVVLRWAVEKEIVVLLQSTNPAHIRANPDLFEWTLDPDAVARLDGLDRGENAHYLDLDDESYGIPA